MLGVSVQASVAGGACIVAGAPDAAGVVGAGVLMAGLF